MYSYNKKKEENAYISYVLFLMFINNCLKYFENYVD